jgi:DNA-binding NarL/FixJ family response regulator
MSAHLRTVLVVENEDFLRSLIAQSLESQGFKVETAANALQAKKMISKVDPDVALLDIDLGDGPTGLDFAAQLAISSPEVGVVFLTDLPDTRFAREDHEVKENQAYLNKRLLQSPEALTEAINAVLYEEGVGSFRHDQNEDRPLLQLTRVQLEILKLIAEGKTNQQIADLRGRSIGATESAITRTLESLGINRDADLNVRVEAVRTYFQAVTTYGKK